MVRLHSPPQKTLWGEKLLQNRRGDAVVEELSPILSPIKSSVVRCPLSVAVRS
jgi:hypothetical protein